MSAVGTDLHRTYVCSARDAMRRRVGGRHVQHRGTNPFPGFESLWARGISEDPVELLDVLPV
eukprot:6841783-Pyramimonas_sp.AAC.1